MGQKLSGSHGGGAVLDSIAEESRHDLFALWPGLDYHLELSFNSLDSEQKGILSYDVLEPVLRHHLMQLGLIEYVTRLATPEGKLQPFEVNRYLMDYGIDLEKGLDILDWKNLMLAWIRRVNDVQEDDIENWQNSVRHMQEQQATNYQVNIEKNTFSIFVSLCENI